MNDHSVFPDLIVIVVNYNLMQDTIECIRSIEVAGIPKEQLLIVDNHSTDGSVESFRKEFGPGLEIIIADENRGYPHALNIGIPRAITKGAEWVLLMNNDTVVAQDFFSELKLASLNFPEYSLIGPMILYFGDPETIWYLGYKAVPGTMIGVGSYRGFKASRYFPQMISIDFMHGCAMMVHKRVFEKIGLFDDTHLIYGDDADFSWRAKLAGFRMGAAPRAKMWHKIARTMGQQKPSTRYLRTRNTIFFYRRYGTKLQYIIMFFFTFIRTLVLMVGDIIHKRGNMLSPQIRGWLDGWFQENMSGS